MTTQGQSPEVAVVSTTVHTDSLANTDWPAIVAGAVLAAAVSFTLFTFGTGIGLSVTSPYPAQTVSAPVFAVILGLWILLVTVMSFLLGGYFTGLLMRRRVASDHETEMRDGMHGVLSWALGVLLAGLMAAATVAGAAKTGVDASAGSAAAGSPPAVGYFVDALLRSDNPSTVAPAETELRRSEVTRIFLNSPKGEFSPADQNYLGRVVMHQSALSEADAAARVTKVGSDYRSAILQLQEAVEKARKFALFLAFAVAATLAIAAAAAWWAAVQGGEHRDQGADLRSYIGWKRGRPVAR